jgi:hypothetical protein
VLEVSGASRREIVYPDDAVTVREQPVDEMRPEKTRGPGSYNL